MKKSLIIKALFGLAGVAFSVSSANAQATITDNIGDLTLGFYATSGSGANESVMVDLGSLAEFTGATAPISLTGINGLAIADLVDTYGTGWASDSALVWGVVAGNGSTTVPGTTGLENLYFTQAENPPGTAAAIIPFESRNTIGGASSGATTFNILLNQATSTTNSNVTIIDPTSDSASYYYLDTQGGTNFVQFEGRIPTIDNNITNVDANGNGISDFQVLLDPQSGSPLTHSGPSTLLGHFVFNTVADTFVYDPVPEPSSVGLAGVGFLSLIGFVALRRRRSSVVA